MSEAILDEYDFDRPKRGDIRRGVVLSVEPNEILVDIGTKRECVIAASDCQKLGGEAIAALQQGQEVSVYIVKPESREGNLIGSLYLAQVENDWARAEALEKKGEVFEGRVSGQNRGGLLVPFGRLRGFVPASHLGGASEDSRDPGTLSQWIGQTLPFKVIEVNRRRNRLILSYRAARRQWRSLQKKSLLETLGEGDVRRGTVSSLASFGAFVNLGGADGLIHVSEMAWYRVEHPSELLQVGQEIEVYILRVDSERGRIGLSLRRLQPDPWTLVEQKYAPGQTVEGTITKLVDFGAFVELERGIEGLIHITELADPVPVRPDAVVLPGDRCLLRVLRVDARSRRIGLSLRAVEPGEIEAWEASHVAAEAADLPAGQVSEPDPSVASGDDDTGAARGEDQA
jgi:small subunit ribosomal protein S1